MQPKLKFQLESKNCVTSARGGRSLFWIVCWLCLAAGVLSLRAQTNPPPAADVQLVSSNRVLLVVDMSSSMKRHLPKTLDLVNKLISSSGDGQMYRGDTLGLWTFNREVYSDFPLQNWDPMAAKQIASFAENFLKQQRFTDGSHFEKVLPDLFSVMQHSDFITVVVIFNGEDRIKGTPIDQEINKLIQQNYKEAEGHGIPMALILQSKRGKIMRYTVTAFPWPVVIPQTPLPKPAPRVPPTTVVPPRAVPVATPAPPVVPNLIVVGKSQTPVSNSPSPIVKPETNAPPAVEKPAPPIFFTPTPPPTFVPAPPPANVTAAASNSPPPPAPQANPNVHPAVIPPGIQPPSASTPPEHVPAQTRPVAAPSVTTEKVPAAAANEPVMSPATNHVLAVISPTPGKPGKLFVAGIILVLVVIGGIILMMRRSRRNSNPSFITRSMNNKRR